MNGAGALNYGGGSTSETLSQVRQRMQERNASPVKRLLRPVYAQIGKPILALPAPEGMQPTPAPAEALPAMAHSAPMPAPAVPATAHPAPQAWQPVPAAQPIQQTWQAPPQREGLDAMQKVDAALAEMQRSWLAQPAAQAAPAAAAPQAWQVQPTATAQNWEAAAPAETERRELGNPAFYGLICLLLTIAGVAAVWSANPVYAPEMYDDQGLAPAVQAFTEGKNYAVFDLNLNIRRMRDLHVAQMKKTPDVAIFGASHWQEAHSGLVKHLDFYNSHVHRDYWEDMLGVTEMWVRHGKLPKRVIIAMRDNLFTPISARKDFLWEPGIPYYRAMAERLGIEPGDYVKQLPYQRMRERLSLAMLYTNMRRWYNADERPHASSESHFKALDALLPDGSITWSSEHMDIFTPERSEREAVSFAELRRNSPPMVEQRGLEAFHKLLEFLKSQGVTVYLVEPPFNPLYYDRLQGSPYMEGLRKIEAQTRAIAARHGLKVIGGFNPHKVGCTAEMYIDAEHANAACLQNIFDEFTAHDLAAAGGTK